MIFKHPKFRFCIFKVEDINFNDIENNENCLICFADHYEIQGDGNLVLFQTIELNDNKIFKMPVSIFPPKTWYSCFLLDEKLNPFVFNNKPNIKKKALIQEENHTSISTNILQQKDKQTIINKKEFNNFSLSTNPLEFQKQKNEWLEFKILEYLEDVEIFNIEECLKYISKDKNFNHFNVIVEDIVWCTSKIIKGKTILPSKFNNEEVQSYLSLILPGIMKRHWDGSINPIFQILSDREETKNVTLIDLTFWLVQNNFF